MTGTATKNVDYVALPATATIPDQAAAVTVTVVPIDDTTVEPDKTVNLTLSSSTAYTLGSPAAATVTIVSDDVQADLVVSALAAPAIGGAGLWIDVTDTTKNQGTGASPASSTVFYLSANSSVPDASDVTLGHPRRRPPRRGRVEHRHQPRWPSRLSLATRVPTT